MALRTILIQGDEALTRKCRKVTVFDARLKQLVGDLIDTLQTSGGVGLAAPQVGVLRRVAIVVDISKKPEEYIPIINPELLETRGSERMLEGCLSVPNIWGYVNRPAWAKIRAQDPDGNWFEREGEGVLAQCFCHEIEHLDGHVFTEKVVEFADPEEVQQL